MERSTVREAIETVEWKKSCEEGRKSAKRPGQFHLQLLCAAQRRLVGYAVFLARR